MTQPIERNALHRKRHCNVGSQSGMIGCDAELERLTTYLYP